MKTYLFKLTLPILFLCSIAVADSSDPFAGKFANCVGDGTLTYEKWRFTGLTKEFTKEFKVSGILMSQSGKYSYKKGTLTIQDFKAGTKELDPNRKFELKAQTTDSGFEYLWKTPKGEEIAHTCTWIK